MSFKDLDSNNDGIMGWGYQGTKMLAHHGVNPAALHGHRSVLNARPVKKMHPSSENGWAAEARLPAPARAVKSLPPVHGKLEGCGMASTSFSSPFPQQNPPRMATHGSLVNHCTSDGENMFRMGLSLECPELWWSIKNVPAERRHFEVDSRYHTDMGFHEKEDPQNYGFQN